MQLEFPFIDPNPAFPFWFAAWELVAPPASFALSGAGSGNPLAHPGARNVA